MISRTVNLQILNDPCGANAAVNECKRIIVYEDEKGVRKEGEKGEKEEAKSITEGGTNQGKGKQWRKGQ